jgi:alpha-glucosidase (family GH31 glycosyl hydrolase)
MDRPIPFFLSNRGYGMFVHTSAPATFDVGASYGNANALLLGDDALHLFVFFGEPKDTLNEYATLAGKSSMPPLWSFGLWMSRVTDFSEDETRAVAAKLRQNRIPSDVIHLHTGWFENDWRCDYKFSTTRFKDPAKMTADLKRDGFHISLWQLPYFVPKNSLFREILAKGLAVRDGKGNLPYEDAVLSSGVTLWSHDIGGVAAKTPEELYRRWMPFGMLTSHSRCHGTPPEEPWKYSAAFMACLPADNVLRRMEAVRRDGAFALASDPLAGKASSTIRLCSQSTK